jgi:hypothetical protein
MRFEKRRALVSWLLGLAAALCLFFGFWAFVYQGYREDFGSEPFQTWPYGTGLFAAAGILILLIIQRARPDLTRSQRVLVVGVVTLLLLLGALGSLSAGQA